MAVDAPGGPTQKVSEIISTFRPCRVVLSRKDHKELRLTDDKRFRPDDSKTHVTSLDYDDSGELAILSRSDDTLQIYNCKEGKHAKELKSQKYGVHCARFSHHGSGVLFASTKVNDDIRYLSTHDNSFIRYFKGHTSPVTCISVSPSSDDFLSASLDNTVKLWNIGSSNPQATLKIHQPHFAIYDPSATVIAIASPPTHSILLYDLRMYDKPPFASFDLQDAEQRFNPQAAGRNWSKVEFSNDGKSLLVATTGPGHFILDAFEGTLKHFCPRKTGRSERRAPGDTSSSRAQGTGDACFSPDGNFLIGGSGGNDGLVAWDVSQEPKEGNILEVCAEMPVPPQATNGRCEVVGYNPKFNHITTADRDIMIWAPDPELAT